MTTRALHLQMLRDEATRLQQAADHLQWSYQRCQGRILLDTHIALWAIADDSPVARYSDSILLV